MKGNESGQDIFRLETGANNPVAAGMFSLVGTALERMFSLHRLGTIYGAMADRGQGCDFAAKALDALNVDCVVSKQDMASIPPSGPLVVVANHPFGGVEGLMLASILNKVRPDVKLIANYLLTRIPELRSLVIAVDPFGDKGSVLKNVGPLKEAMAWVRRGGALAIFPAGEVSHLQLRKGRISDPPWSLHVARLVKRLGAPVLPVFFHGANSALFQLGGLVHPRLRTLMLPRELLNKRGARVRVSVGNVIPASRLATFESEKELGDYVRSKTYLLRYRCDGDDVSGGSPAGSTQVQQKDREKKESDRQRLTAEVQSLPPEQRLGETEDLAILFAKAEQIPNVLYEIGLLREHTFRQVGEGTGKEVDLDRFDLYYVHLFLWHKRREEVVGAYRLGLVDRIVDRYGPRGLYTNTLFVYKPPFYTKIRKAIELGRSFIRPEYQRSYLPLLLLWKGIARFVALNPEYTTLFGPVTISNLYHTVSKKLICSFLNQHRSDLELARLVTPRRPFKGGSKGVSRDLLSCIADLDELSSAVAHIEADRKGVPVLMKQYLKLGGKLLGFNVDRDFSDALDGLILVDLRRCERKVLARYMGREEAEAFLALHGAASCEPLRRNGGLRKAV